MSCCSLAQRGVCIGKDYACCAGLQLQRACVPVHALLRCWSVWQPSVPGFAWSNLNSWKLRGHWMTFDPSWFQTNHGSCVSCLVAKVQLLWHTVGQGWRWWILQRVLHCGVLAAANVILHAHRLLHPEEERKVRENSKPVFEGFKRSSWLPGTPALSGKDPMQSSGFLKSEQFCCWIWKAPFGGSRFGSLGLEGHGISHDCHVSQDRGLVYSVNP